MADFGAVQPRQFIMDSSRQNGATLGEFHQNNNRYLCTLELFDHSVPVSIPAGAEISIKCKKAGTNQVYVLDKNSPDFAAKVSFTPRENKITVDRWGAMISYELLLKNLMTRVKIQDKQNAFIYALMKWTQDAPATLPILTGYQNTVP